MTKYLLTTLFFITLPTACLFNLNTFNLQRKYNANSPLTSWRLYFTNKNSWQKRKMKLTQKNLEKKNVKPSVAQQ